MSHFSLLRPCCCVSLLPCFPVCYFPFPCLSMHFPIFICFSITFPRSESLIYLQQPSIFLLFIFPYFFTPLFVSFCIIFIRNVIYASISTSARCIIILLFLLLLLLLLLLFLFFLFLLRLGGVGEGRAREVRLWGGKEE